MCFVGKVHLPDFLQQRLETKKGKVIEIPATAPVFKNGFADDDLKEISARYELDHRNWAKLSANIRRTLLYNRAAQGLNLGGFEKPLFVIGTDTDRNIIYTGMGEDHPGLVPERTFYSSSRRALDTRRSET